MRIGLFGAAPDTGNMGVSALCHAFLDAMTARLPDCEFVIFDNGRGRRNSSYTVGDVSVPIVYSGVRGGKRLYRSENLNTMAAMARWPMAGRIQSGLALVDSCDVVMDVSGGDSFSDIYGETRFHRMLLPKRIALRRGVPLLLLPQTYGPYTSEGSIEQVRLVLLKAGQAWARDARSHEVMQSLLGADFDPAIHRSGVDMAFGLEARCPGDGSHVIPVGWQRGAATLIGLNVSGLIWHAQRLKGDGFGFKADYKDVIMRLLVWLMEETYAKVLLIPHVQVASGQDESDDDACAEVLAKLGDRLDWKSRCAVVPPGCDSYELKWIISQCDWFCGTRMHATIAGLSSGVPTASIVYSDKAQGVFDTCGQGDGAVDPRIESTAGVLTQLQAHFLRRQCVRAALDKNLPAIRGRLSDQMDTIAEFARQQVRIAQEQA
ncbi:MAG: polysaccharide pyruvyl transferase family protein [Gammaproteobacteria bacterium]|nr:polysaccharide pyruvyl transferase family protein [Gammaproteobacteria bacterium]